MKNKYTTLLLVIVSLLFVGWGAVGHKIINIKTVISFPAQMNQFFSWSSILAQHASDADNRKDNDPNESPKHFIDIDEYSEFNSTHTIPQDYYSLTAKYGNTFVMDNGILPWAIIATFDSLKAQFSRKDFNRAQLTAADLGHYVGDSHMPLHITKNYNGQLSGQSGVHSRYESTLIGNYQNLIQYTPDSAKYVTTVRDFVFSYIYENYKCVDSVLSADKSAKSFAGGSTSNSIYYQKLWDLTGNFTIRLFSEASSRLASLIYTAWVDAGSPDPSATKVANTKDLPLNFVLYQNYPNPFNPSTVISYQLSAFSHVQLKVYDMLGREVALLVDKEQEPGNYNSQFSIRHFQLPSGVYFYQLKAGNFIQTKKMILLK
ncbi:MAG: T9SS type A sorting domain-containing protein [Ignavibacteriales bacterium]|nr:T9SS type A sorting domain-containing protein [Ignavibacteriales bacterium]